MGLGSRCADEGCRHCCTGKKEMSLGSCTDLGGSLAERKEEAEGALQWGRCCSCWTGRKVGN